MSGTDKTITICMGSSCYARGNVYNVEAIQSWLRQHGLDGKIELRGTLCEGLCRQGPVVKIGDTVYKGVAPSSIAEILAHEFPEAKNG
jgi:NADH:ubiquinone oxidoreductase subunit E